MFSAQYLLIAPAPAGRRACTLAARGSRIRGEEAVRSRRREPAARSRSREEAARSLEEEAARSLEEAAARSLEEAAARRLVAVAQAVGASHWVLFEPCFLKSLREL